MAFGRSSTTIAISVRPFFDPSRYNEWTLIPARERRFAIFASSPGRSSSSRSSVSWSSNPKPAVFSARSVVVASVVTTRRNDFSFALSLAIASVEIWKWHGGQKRLDRRYNEAKVWLPRGYFQVYFKERNWEIHPDDRVFVNAEVAAPAGAKEPEPIVIPIRTRRRSKARAGSS